MMDDISPRKRVVLAAVISMHTADGEPVGSKSLLLGQTPLNVSSATLRSEMAQLTDIGLLDQPHISAGRVPTLLGYKYFVHNLMRRPPLQDSERAEIYKLVHGFDSDPVRAAEEAAAKLSDITGLVGIATTPENANLSVAHFKIMKAGRYNIAVIGITSAGGVKSRVCRVASEISDAELAEIELLLNRGLVFVSGIDITKDYLEGLRAGADCFNAATAPIFEAARQTVVAAGEAQVFIKGSENLLNFRELNLKEALGFLANGNQIRNLSRRVGDAVTAFIGDETGYVYSDTLSVLLARYRVGNGLSGSVGVVGPLRMDYEYLVPRLQCFCNVLSDALISA